MLELFISNISSMTGLDMNLQSNLVTLTGPDNLDLRISLPLRIDADAVKAAFKKKKSQLIVSGRVLTVAEGQPEELMENVTNARREQLGFAPEDSPKLPEPTLPETALQPPPPPDVKGLYDKYKNMSTTAVSTPSDPSYSNTTLTVMGHPTNDLQLISPSALVAVVSSMLTLAHAQPSDSPQLTIKEIMESFPSKAQSELARQLLMQAVKYAQQSNGVVALPESATHKFVQLAEFQQKKISAVLAENKKKDEAKAQAEARVPLTDLEGSQFGEKRSTHAHAPVFDKDDENTSPTLAPVFIAKDLLVNGATNSGTISELLLKTSKGSEKRRVKQVVGQKATQVAAKLQQNSFAVLDNFISESKVKELRDELDNLQPHYTPSEIWVGKGADLGAQIVVPDVRGDKVLWMCGGHAAVDSTLFDSAGVQPKAKGAIEPCDISVKAQIGSTMGKGGIRKISGSVMGKFSNLKQVLESIDKFVFEELTKKDPRLARVNSRSDAMLAVYPGGGSRFQKHVDNTANDGRRLTVLIYLNENWSEDKGGFLRVYGSNDAEEDVAPKNVLPLGGRMAMFYSDKVPHEVTSTDHMRYSMTVWYYDSLERSEAVASSASMGSGDEKGDWEAQAEASKFIKETLAGEFGEGDKTGRTADEDELKRIGVLAGKLGEKATKIVAGICGAPSEAHFLQAARSLTPETLGELRRGLSKMGV